MTTSCSIPKEPTLDTSSQQSPPILRLMLHTEDGMVPYLTPDLLLKHFPPSTLWCLGIAVNETCIAPIYSSHNPPNLKQKKKKQPKKRAIDELHTKSDGNEPATSTTNRTNSTRTNESCDIVTPALTTAAATDTTTNTVNARKPRGYTFSSTGGLYQLDEWIYPYTRIVVPTFHNKPNGVGIPATSSKSSSSMNGTLSEIRLWTSNGRHSITTSQYIDCATNALNGNIIVPLYPIEEEEEPSVSPSPVVLAAVPHPNGNTNIDVDDQKTRSSLGNQKLIISQHTEAIQRMQEPTSPPIATATPQLCVPFLVSDRYCYFIDRRKRQIQTNEPASDNTAKSVDQLDIRDATHDKPLVKEAACKAHLSWMIDNVRAEHSVDKEKDHFSTIIMLIGWHAISDMDHRWHLLQSLQSIISSLSPSISIDISPTIPPPLALGTISTCSTHQILQLIEYSTLSTVGVDGYGNDNQNAILIGTNLPTVWSKLKRCFVIDTSLAMDDTETPSPPIDVDGCYDFNPPATKVQEHAFYSDSRPLMKNCNCMTCTTYTRAYLYHLVCAQELLVEILFFIHNFHHMLNLIQVVNAYHNSKDVDSIRRLCLSMKSKLRMQADE